MIVLQSDKTPTPQKDPLSREPPVKDPPDDPNHRNMEVDKEETATKMNMANENGTTDRLTQRDSLSENLELDPSHYRG
jgi:hypothetical protein